MNLRDNPQGVIDSVADVLEKREDLHKQELQRQYPDFDIDNGTNNREQQDEN